MRILDRYVLTAFLKNYLMSFLVLIGLFIVLDMTFKFDDFVEVRNVAGATGVQGAIATIRNIADYYAYQSFLVFAQLSPLIPGVAAAFTLMRFSRFNELVAFLAAGVPLLRVAMPIIIAAVLLNALVVVDQELIIPNIIPKLARHSTEVGGDAKTFPVNMLADEDGSRLSVRIYTPETAASQPEMQWIDLIETRDGRPTAHVWARSGQWDPQTKTWGLEQGYRVANLLPDSSADAMPRPIATLPSPITPLEVRLYRKSNTADWLSTSQLNALLSRSQGTVSLDLLRVKHSRFTLPLLNIVMLLLSIPAVLTRAPGDLKVAALKCFAYQGMCMSLVFVTQNLAGRPPVGWESAWPALMAWLPIFVFGPISVILLDRVKT